MKLSDKRKMLIYQSVSDRLVELRIEVSEWIVGQGVNSKMVTKLDTIIARAQGEVAHNAVKAAEGETMKKECPPVQIGQMYKERAKRFERYVKVLEIEGEKAITQACDVSGSVHVGWHQTKIRLTNLQTRFTLIGE